MLRGNPFFFVVLGIAALLVGAFGVSEFLEHDANDGVAPVAQVRGRSLRGYGEASAPSRPRGNTAMLMMFGPVGLVLVVLGAWHLSRQTKLLQEGVPVVGYLSDVELGGKHPFLAYRFEDEAGRVHDGRYNLVFGWLAEFQVGQEVTVVYDREDPRKHLLDIDDLRRAEARGNRLEGRRS